MNKEPAHVVLDEDKKNKIDEKPAHVSMGLEDEDWSDCCDNEKEDSGKEVITLPKLSLKKIVMPVLCISSALLGASAVLWFVKNKGLPSIDTMTGTDLLKWK